MSSEKITLIEGIQILNNNKETAKVLNNFFSTIIKNLKIPQYKEQDLISASISDTVARIVKNRAYPSIIAIKETCNSSRYMFQFFICRERRNFKRNKKFESK